MTEPDFVTVVSGLPRSGTSLMMQMLAAGGLPPLTDQVRAPDESNPQGYYEDERVKRLRTDRGWLAEARGRVVKVIHLLLPELPMDGQLNYRIVFLRRRMEEVLASQRVMLDRSGRPGGAAVEPARLAAVFETQLARADAFIREHADRVSRLDVEHHALLADPAAEAGRINAFLGGGLDVEKMAGVVDPKLWRQRANI